MLVIHIGTCACMLQTPFHDFMWEGFSCHEPVEQVIQIYMRQHLKAAFKAAASDSEVKRLPPDMNITHYSAFLVIPLQGISIIVLFSVLVMFAINKTNNRSLYSWLQISALAILIVSEYCTCKSQACCGYRDLTCCICLILDEEAQEDGKTSQNQK